MVLIIVGRDQALDAERNENRSLTDRLAPPGLQQPAIDTEPASDFRDVDPWSRTLRDDGRLDRLRRSSLDRPSSPPRCPGDQLDPAIRICFVPVLMHGIKLALAIVPPALF